MRKTCRILMIASEKVTQRLANIATRSSLVISEVGTYENSVELWESAEQAGRSMHPFEVVEKLLNPPQNQA